MQTGTSPERTTSSFCFFFSAVPADIYRETAGPSFQRGGRGTWEPHPSRLGGNGEAKRPPSRAPIPSTIVNSERCLGMSENGVYILLNANHPSWLRRSGLGSGFFNQAYAGALARTMRGIRHVLHHPLRRLLEMAKGPPASTCRHQPPTSSVALIAHPASRRRHPIDHGRPFLPHLCPDR